MKVASFVYYGRTEGENRLVTMASDHEGNYIVAVKGYPALTRRTSDRSEAEDILRGWWEFAQKDWGASEIEWVVIGGD